MTGIPADTDMQFRTGSVGIAYMATILLQLAQQGVVDIDAPAARYAAEDPAGQGRGQDHPATARQLQLRAARLRRRPGLPQRGRVRTRSGTGPRTTSSPTRSTTTSGTRPGTNWSYSHANFVLEGEALEKITGVPLDQLLKKRVLEPLGLDNTFINAKPPIPDPVHAFTSERGTYEESTFWNPSWTTAHGAILTQNVCDLATSARAIGSGQPALPRVAPVPAQSGHGGAG